MFEGQFLLLLVINVRDSLCIVEAMYDTGNELWKLYMMIDNLELNPVHNISEVDERFRVKKVTIQEIKRQMVKIDRQFDEREEFMNPKTIRDKFPLPPFDFMMFKCMDRFEIIIQDIDEFYREFKQYMKNSNSHSDNMLQNLPAQKILDIQTNIEVVREIVIDAHELLPNHVNLISAIVGSASTHHEEICNNPQSISDVLIHMFKMIMIAEMKVNVMLAFDNIYQYGHREEWREWNSRARKQFQRLFGNYINIFELNMSMADPLPLRACDPNDIRIRDVSFYELEGTFQTTLFRYHWASCKYDSCNKVWFDKAYQCGPTLYDVRSSCGQIVAECTYLSAIEACVLKNGPHKFLYVNSTELGLLGVDARCSKNKGYIISDGQGWQMTHAACACNCYSNHNKVNLAIMESNVKLNRVITGVRFLRKDRILYIQPKEGKLSRNGHILRNTLRWLPIREEMKESYVRIDRNNKVFFFDDLRLPSGYALTGVKFNKVIRGNVTGFAIEIFGSPFSYTSGELVIDDKSRISIRELSEDPGKGLSFKAVSSANVTSWNILSSEDVKYVSLEQSTLQSDFGQSTLPFIDGIPVISRPQTPLSGIGIIHKVSEGYAGYISLRVYAIKYENYFNEFRVAHMRNDKVIFENSF